MDLDSEISSLAHRLMDENVAANLTLTDALGRLQNTVGNARVTALAHRVRAVMPSLTAVTFEVDSESCDDGTYVDVIRTATLQFADHRSEEFPLQSDFDEALDFFEPFTDHDNPDAAAQAAWTTKGVPDLRAAHDALSEFGYALRILTSSTQYEFVEETTEAQT